MTPTHAPVITDTPTGHSIISGPKHMEQYTLDGEPVKRCQITIRTNKGPLINAKIGGPQAHRIVKAIVDILNDNQPLWEADR